MKRVAAWLLTRVLPVPVWALAMGSLWLCVRMVSTAKRLAPDLPPSNCWTYAAQEWDEMMTAWIARGSVAGDEPYGTFRPSRKNPRRVMHVLVAEGYDSDTERMPLRSFKPEIPSDARWWQFCRRVVFDGRVERGD
jgi:hypothetical protein